MWLSFIGTLSFHNLQMCEREAHVQYCLWVCVFCLLTLSLTLPRSRVLTSDQCFIHCQISRRAIGVMHDEKYAESTKLRP